MFLTWQRCVITATVALVQASSSRAQAAPRNLREFLAQDARLTATQLAAVERGQVVVNTLPTGDQRDVAVMGVVRVSAPRGAVVNALRASGSAAGRAARGPVHIFSTPATLDDVAALRLTAGELDELARCRPNECNFKLPAAAMSAIQPIVGSKTADAEQRAEEYLGRRMIDYVTAYRQRGNAAMIVYDDLGSVQSSVAFDAMLRDSSHIFRVAPSLARFLVDYPRASLPNEADVIYWSVDALPHVRSVLRIMHEVTYAPADVPGATVIAAKQLYADHYFEAGLELLVALDDSLTGFAAHSGTAVVAVHHYRFDNLPSGGVLNVRGRVLDGLRGAVAEELRRLGGDAAH